MKLFKFIVLFVSLAGVTFAAQKETEKEMVPPKYKEPKIWPKERCECCGRILPSSPADKPEKFATIEKSYAEGLEFAPPLDPKVAKSKEELRLLFDLAAIERSRGVGEDEALSNARNAAERFTRLWAAEGAGYAAAQNKLFENQASAEAAARKASAEMKECMRQTYYIERVIKNRPPREAAETSEKVCRDRMEKSQNG